jgi:hypothetical protein
VAIAMELSFGLGASACAALPRAQAPSHQFLERNYVFATRGDTTLLYEAQAATHILLVDGLPDAYDRISSDSMVRAAGTWRVIATPMFRIRQLNDSSAAVRTPSFMPRVSVERIWARRLGAVTGDQFNPAFDGANVTGVRLTLAHHSNGQAGCFRAGFVPTDSHSETCVPAPGADTSIVKLNRANGDFSTTFFSLMLHSTWMNRNGANIATHSLGVAVNADWHMPGLFGALSDEQRALYGTWRARGQVEGMQMLGTSCGDRIVRTAGQRLGCWLSGRARFTVDHEWVLSKLGALADRVHPSIVPWRGSSEVSYAFDALLGAGVFLRWNDGQDYYNIGFVNRRRVFLYGGMLDLSGVDRIGKKIVQ